MYFREPKLSEDNAGPGLANPKNSGEWPADSIWWDRFQRALRTATSQRRLWSIQEFLDDKRKGRTG